MPGPTQPAPALNPYPGTAADGSRPSGLHCQPACGTRQCPADKVKKVIRDAHEEFTDEKRLEIVKEIGDVLWYCATLARDLGYELDDVAQMNVDKLRSRMQRHIISGSGDNR